MLVRRQFLQSSSLITLAPSIPGFIGQSARAAEATRGERALVVIQLTGGNDGFNTLVPFRDEAYVRLRPKLRIADDRVLKLTDDFGLHPSMRDMADLFEQHRLTVVQGTGYPSPSRSHDVSMAVWQTARSDPESHSANGWLGRALDWSASNGRSSDSMLIGTEATPTTLLGRRSRSATVSSMDEFTSSNLGVPTTSDAKQESDDLRDFLRSSIANAAETSKLMEDVRSRGPASTVDWPSNSLAERLNLVAQLIKADVGTRVFYTIQPGYDTHSVQAGPHSRLLRTLSQSLRAFLDDLAEAGLEDRVLVLCFSEFGRQLKENASAGTDHGTAGPIFLGGSATRGGLHGKAPDLSQLKGNAPEFTIDFRRVYATVLQHWLDVPTEQLLGGRFDPLHLLTV